MRGLPDNGLVATSMARAQDGWSPSLRCGKFHRRDTSFQRGAELSKGTCTTKRFTITLPVRLRPLRNPLAKIGQPVTPELSKLRPHSGRATLITELMGEGMTTAMSMKYARHSPDSFKVHLKYGRLSLDDVKKACDLLPSSRPRAKWSALSTKELLAAQKGIDKELRKRLAAS